MMVFFQLTKVNSKSQLKFLLLILLINIHVTTSQNGKQHAKKYFQKFLFWYMKNNLTRSIFTDNCNINQTCMKVQNCPYTKKLLKDARTTNDAKEKEKIIGLIKSRICGNTADRTVCCNIPSNTDAVSTNFK